MSLSKPEMLAYTGISAILGMALAAILNKNSDDSDE